MEHLILIGSLILYGVIVTYYTNKISKRER
jgi:hypothetical protein